MKRNYRYGWDISREGFKEIVPYYLTREEADKYMYVGQYIDSSVREANCGWHKIDYCVCDMGDGTNRREFARMYADKDDAPNSARWIDVTAESKGSIAEAVWSLVFA